MGALSGPQWIVIALVFFGIVFYMARLRHLERKLIEERFPGRTALAQSFGVGFFGLASNPERPKRQSGFLVLFPDRLFFRSRNGRVEIEIEAIGLVRVYHSHEHKGVQLGQLVMTVDFLDSAGSRESAAFRVPYPHQWISIIKSTLQPETGGDEAGLTKSDN